MESKYKKSEFVVSEDTAKWVRLIQDLHDVWQKTSDLVDNDDHFMSEFFPHFEAIEKQCAKWMGETVLNNMGWLEFPKNMI